MNSKRVSGRQRGMSIGSQRWHGTPRPTLMSYLIQLGNLYLSVLYGMHYQEATNIHN